jgi:hypothetical protein
MPQVFPTADADAPAAASSLLWSSGDLAAEPAADLTGGGTVTWGGVTSQTIQNAGTPALFELDGSTGLRIQYSTSVDYWNATFTATVIPWLLSDLDPSPSQTAIYVWVVTMATTTATPAANYEGPICGIRTARQTLGKDAHARVFYNSGIKVRASRGGNDTNDQSLPSGVTDPEAIIVVSSFGEGHQVLLNDTAPTGPVDGARAAYRTMAASAGTANPSTPTLDYTDAACECYIGAIGRVTGSSGIMVIKQIDLYRFDA